MERGTKCLKSDLLRFCRIIIFVIIIIGMIKITITFLLNIKWVNISTYFWPVTSFPQRTAVFQHFTRFCIIWFYLRNIVAGLRVQSAIESWSNHLPASHSSHLHSATTTHGTLWPWRHLPTRLASLWMGKWDQLYILFYLIVTTIQKFFILPIDVMQKR